MSAVVLSTATHTLPHLQRESNFVRSDGKVAPAQARGVKLCLAIRMKPYPTLYSNMNKSFLYVLLFSNDDIL